MSPQGHSQRRVVVADGLLIRPFQQAIHLADAVVVRLDLADPEAIVRTHLENIYERLQVSSRTAAVTRAFADRVA